MKSPFSEDSNIQIATGGTNPLKPKAGSSARGYFNEGQYAGQPQGALENYPPNQPPYPGQAYPQAQGAQGHGEYAPQYPPQYPPQHHPYPPHNIPPSSSHQNYP